MTEKTSRADSAADDPITDALTIDVRTCEVCGRSTALPMCAHCGFDPVEAQAAIDRRKGK